MKSISQAEFVLAEHMVTSPGIDLGVKVQSKRNGRHPLEEILTHILNKKSLPQSKVIVCIKTNLKINRVKIPVPKVSNSPLAHQYVKNKEA